MRNMDWNTNPTVKRWVLLGGAVLLLALLLTVCYGGGDTPATAATIAEDPAGDVSFTVQLVPTTAGVTLSADGKATRKCWYWRYEWQNHDGLNRLRFAFGREDIACTNAAETKWVATPTFDPYHYLGYWHHDKTVKSKSDFGYSTLNMNTTWSFSYKPLGVPLQERDKTLRCKLQANNHTAYCTLYS